MLWRLDSAHWQISRAAYHHPKMTPHASLDSSPAVKQNSLCKIQRADCDFNQPWQIVREMGGVFFCWSVWTWWSRLSLPKLFKQNALSLDGCDELIKIWSRVCVCGGFDVDWAFVATFLFGNSTTFQFVLLRRDGADNLHEALQRRNYLNTRGGRGRFGDMVFVAHAWSNKMHFERKNLPACFASSV